MRKCELHQITTAQRTLHHLGVTDNYQPNAVIWILSRQEPTATAKTDHGGLLLLLAKLLWSPANLLASWLAHNRSKGILRDYEISELGHLKQVEWGVKEEIEVQFKPNLNFFISILFLLDQGFHGSLTFVLRIKENQRVKDRAMEPWSQKLYFSWLTLLFAFLFLYKGEKH